MLLTIPHLFNGLLLVVQLRAEKVALYGEYAMRESRPPLVLNRDYQAAWRIMSH